MTRSLVLFSSVINTHCDLLGFFLLNYHRSSVQVEISLMNFSFCRLEMRKPVICGMLENLRVANFLFKKITKNWQAFGNISTSPLDSPKHFRAHTTLRPKMTTSVIVSIIIS